MLSIPLFQMISRASVIKVICNCPLCVPSLFLINMSKMRPPKKESFAIYAPAGLLPTTFTSPFRFSYLHFKIIFYFEFSIEFIFTITVHVLASISIVIQASNILKAAKLKHFKANNKALRANPLGSSFVEVSQSYLPR